MHSGEMFEQLLLLFIAFMHALVYLNSTKSKKLISLISQTPNIFEDPLLCKLVYSCLYKTYVYACLCGHVCTFLPSGVTSKQGGKKPQK